ncbi:MAG TPA: TlyA family RNA methyltransferase [Beijerinckiaceae bacterium]|nr:TlyA family RNA methyltransferase [Beijerinckiaceae bacterium]
MTRRRADVLLVERGLFESRAKAQAAIGAGLVSADGEPVRKASDQLATDADLAAEAPHPWVSRGGVKLAAALDAFAIDPSGRLCLDLGASTGGFTDVLLARGATKVYAVDVGHGQIHRKIAADPRVIDLEGADARKLTRKLVPDPIEILATDVSFISLKLALPPVIPLLAPAAYLVALIKPQFEAGPGRVKKGVVRDETVHRAVCDDLARFVESLGFGVLGLIPSPILGGAGNREFLIGARRG